jgi:type I restriction enzyme S subunit
MLKLFELQLSKLGSGSTFTSINTPELKKFEIPLPPSLEEQERVAHILNEQMAIVEKARAAAEEQLETINSIPTALLKRAFNGGL